MKAIVILWITVLTGCTSIVVNPIKVVGSSDSMLVESHRITLAYTTGVSLWMTRTKQTTKVINQQVSTVNTFVIRAKTAVDDARELKYRLATKGFMFTYGSSAGTVKLTPGKVKTLAIVTQVRKGDLQFLFVPNSYIMVKDIEVN